MTAPARSELTEVYKDQAAVQSERTANVVNSKPLFDDSIMCHPWNSQTALLLEAYRLNGALG